MRILIILLFLISSTQTVQLQTPVSLVVEKIEVIKFEYNEDNNVNPSSSIIKFPISDTLPPDRRITFKITNESSKSVIIYGILTRTIFIPAGYMLEYDKESGKWNYPVRNSKVEDISYIEKQDKKILNPKESFEFDSLVDSEEDGNKVFKRTVYFSYEECNKPVELSSSEFLLK